MVEQEAVNFEAAGSSPASGAIKNPLLQRGAFLCPAEGRTRTACGSANEKRRKECVYILFPSIARRSMSLSSCVVRPPEPRKNESFWAHFFLQFCETEPRTVVGVSRGSVVKATHRNLFRAWLQTCVVRPPEAEEESGKSVPKLRVLFYKTIIGGGANTSVKTGFRHRSVNSERCLQFRDNRFLAFSVP